MWRMVASSNPMAISAQSSVPTSGVLVTAIPRSLHLCRSTWHFHSCTEYWKVRACRKTEEPWSLPYYYYYKKQASKQTSLNSWSTSQALNPKTYARIIITLISAGTTTTTNTHPVNSNTGFGHNFELRQLVDERSIHPHCSGSDESTDGLRILSQICFFVALLPQREHSVLRLQQTLEVGQGAVHEHTGLHHHGSS